MFAKTVCVARFKEMCKQFQCLSAPGATPNLSLQWLPEYGYMRWVIDTNLNEARASQGSLRWDHKASEPAQRTARRQQPPGRDAYSHSVPRPSQWMILCLALQWSVINECSGRSREHGQVQSLGLAVESLWKSYPELLAAAHHRPGRQPEQQLGQQKVRL